MVDHRPGSRQLSEMLDEIRSAVGALERGFEIEVKDDQGRTSRVWTPTAVQLLDMTRAAKRDGYRANTRYDTEASETAVRDEDGKAVPVPRISDPTGELASSQQKVTDPIWIHAESLLRGISGALGDLRMARGALFNSTKYVDTSPAEPGCSSHERVGEWIPVEDNGRCRWCYDFWLAEGQDPTPELLELRAQGKRITQAMVEQALRPKKKKSKRAA